ncbi:MAG: ATP-binding protein, partial [Ktedonobacterales bacterium]
MPAAPPPVIHDNLPRPLTRFIGRSEELQSLRAVLQSERLVTLTGVGGCGKTRLAREVAASARDLFPDGVRWIDLAPLADEGLVAQAIAGAWGVLEQPGRSIMDTLAESLKSRQVLLILDNCEHLAAACAWCGQILLERCPALTILATSRESLGVPGETIVPVAPLPVPDEDQCEDVAQLVRTDVISLFLDRARAAAPSFKLSAENVRDVAQLCRKLDGIPLAIELAAARVRLLNPRQIAERLQHAFQVLGSGTRGAPHRQQTLQATLDWSFALLAPVERALFRALAAFV